MELTEFDKQTFDNIEKFCVVGKWYSVKKERDDYDQLLDSITKFGLCYGIMEIVELEDRFKYKITLRENEVEKKLMEESFTSVSKKDDFYKKAYYPENLSKQLEIARNTPKRDIPGVSSRADIGRKILEAENAAKNKMTKEQQEKMERIRKFREWSKS